MFIMYFWIHDILSIHVFVIWCHWEAELPRCQVFKSVSLNLFTDFDNDLMRVKVKGKLIREKGWSSLHLWTPTVVVFLCCSLFSDLSHSSVQFESLLPDQWEVFSFSVFLCSWLWGHIAGWVIFSSEYNNFYSHCCNIHANYHCCWSLQWQGLMAC